ncbi:MAG: patatin-like phospholipase family protein [Chlamydiia bacterium]
MGIYQFLKIKVFILLFIGLMIGSYFLANHIYKIKEIASYENFYKDEEKIALDVLKPLMNEPNPEVNLKQERIKVLIIEGGGIKGAYPVVLLNYLEKKTGKPISELYDVLGGTSIGSVITSLLSIPGEIKPKFTAEDLVTLLPIAVKSLEPSFKQKFLSGYGLLSAIVNNQKFIQLLKSTCGNIPFSKALNHLVLYGYNFSTTTLTAFHNRGADLKLANPLLYQLLGGTTAFFGIIPPNKILLNPLKNPEFIGDAGIVVINPVVSSIIDLQKMYPGKKFLITYIVMHPKQTPDRVDFPFYSGSIEAGGITPPLIHTAENQLIREFMQSLKDVYRFDQLTEIGINQNMDWMNVYPFDFSDQNFDNVLEYAKLFLHQNKETLDTIAEELLKD